MITSQLEEARLARVNPSWPVKRLRHIARLVGGGTPSKGEAAFWSDGTVPWVSPKDMKSRVILETEDYITEDAVDGSATTYVEAGSPLMVVRSGILKHTLPVAIAGKRLTLNQDMKAFRLTNEIDSGFFVWWLEGQSSDLLLEWRQLGATVESIDTRMMMNGRIALPDLDTQNAVAAFLNREVAHIDQIIEKAGGKEAAKSAARGSLLFLLQEKRAALITAAVTGQIAIQKITIESSTAPSSSKFRLIIGAEIIRRHRGNPKFGRVKLQKELYLAEAHIGISELHGNYQREAAGPLDRSLIDETERVLEAEGYYRKNQPDGTGTAVTYTPLAKAGQHTNDLQALLGWRANALRNLIDLLRDLDTGATEAVTTLYAVWNDALLDGQQPDDVAIINGVLTEWHAEKGQKFRKSDLETWLAWMKRKGLTPRGQGPHTTHTMTRDLFA